MRIYLKRFHQNKLPQEAGFTIIEFIIATFVFSFILLLLTSGLVKLSRSYYKGIVSSRTQDTARNITEAISRPLQFNGDNFVQLTPLPTGKGTVYGFCVGTKRFSYILENPADPTDTESTLATGGGSGNHILLEDDVSLPPTNLIRCTATTPQPLDVTQQDPPSSGPYTELMGADMWLNELQVCQVTQPLPAVSDLFSVNVRVLYGPSDLQSTNTSVTGPCNGTPPPAPPFVPAQQCANDQVSVSLLGSEFCAVSEFDTVVEQRVVPGS